MIHVGMLTFSVGMRRNNSHIDVVQLAIKIPIATGKLTSGNIPVEIEIGQFSFQQTCQFNNRAIIFFHCIAGA